MYLLPTRTIHNYRHRGCQSVSQSVINDKSEMKGKGYIGKMPIHCSQTKPHPRKKKMKQCLHKANQLKTCNYEVIRFEMTSSSCLALLKQAILATLQSLLARVHCLPKYQWGLSLKVSLSLKPSHCLSALGGQFSYQMLYRPFHIQEHSKRCCRLVIMDGP